MSNVRSFAITAFAGLSLVAPDGVAPRLAHAAEIRNVAPVIDTAGPKAASDVDHLIVKGWDALRHGDLDVAVATLDAALMLDDTNALALRYRGSARMQKRDYDGAIADFDKVVAIEPNDVEAYRMRGNIWFLKRDRERAINDYNRAIEINPRDSVAYLLRGIYWASQNNRANAVSDFDRAIAEDPDSVEAYLQRGLIHEREGKFDLAFSDYDAAIRIGPYNGRAYTKRAGIWMQRGPTEDNLNHAIADLQQAVRVNSSDQTARGLLSQMTAMRELLQKAKAETNSADKADSRLRTKAEIQ